ncbi:MAG: alpha/beta fold hydrolase [Candidatus Tectomicrobia bacterium]
MQAWLFVLGWILVLGGGGLGHLIQTAGGIEIEDVRFEFEQGKELSALLYKPANATLETPAPGILAVHGYINSRETQSGFAIEFARRGYVVLAIDQTGHGFSEGAAFSAGFGGPAALRYLRNLPFVDTNNIGLEGHSMGGWTSLAAAADQPEGYRSVALVGSSTGLPFAAAGTPTSPRNLGVIFSRFDEFADLMWGVRDARDVTRSEKLQAVFGTQGPIEPGRVYGSIAAGTGRWLATPNTTHPGDHLSTEAIADAVTWMDRTLVGGMQRAETEQIWFWKEIGTLIALVGGVCIVLGSFELLVTMRPFAAIAGKGEGAVAQPGWTWLGGLLVTTAIPAMTYFLFTGWGAAFSANGLFPQGITNQILVWALGNALITIAVTRVIRLASPAATDTSVAINLPVTGLAALASVLSLYLAVAVSDWLFKTDLRFWVIALKPLAPHHVPVFLAYLIAFAAFFYVSQRAWHSAMSLQAGAIIQYATAIVGSVGGLLLMLGSIYVYLFVTGHLPGVDPLFTIVAIQFVPILTITSIISVFAWRRTGHAAAGAIICGLFVTWYIVAGQATHV